MIDRRDGVYSDESMQLRTAPAPRLRLLLPKVGHLLAQVAHDQEVDLGGAAWGGQAE